MSESKEMRKERLKGMQGMAMRAADFGRMTDAVLHNEFYPSFDEGIHENLCDELGLPLDPLWRLYVLEKSLWVTDLLPIEEEQAKHFGESTEPWERMDYEEMAPNLYGSWYEEWQDEIHPQDCDLGYAHMPKPRPYNRRYKFCLLDEKLYPKRTEAQMRRVKEMGLGSIDPLQEVMGDPNDPTTNWRFQQKK